MQINDDELRQILSKNIKSARQNLNLTQESLAELSDISLNFLKDLEGSKSGTSLLTLLKLCHALNMTPNQLLKDLYKEPNESNDNLMQKISLLNEYEKNAILSLIDYFTSHNSQN